MSARQKQEFIQPTYYDILGIAPTATDADIKLAYRKLVLEWHPDKQTHDSFIAERNLKIINEAYSQLKTRSSRERYNQIIRLQHKANVLSQSGNKQQNTWGRFWTWLTNLESKET